VRPRPQLRQENRRRPAGGEEEEQKPQQEAKKAKPRESPASSTSSSGGDDDYDCVMSDDILHNSFSRQDAIWPFFFENLRELRYVI